MIRNAVETRKRILTAATIEFSRYGLAGARVNRIAKDAKANKQLIYEYYLSKENLFDVVFENVVTKLVDTIDIDFNNTADYIMRLYDYLHSNREVGRLAKWHKLERESVTGVHSVTTSSADKKLDAVRKAQDNGLVNRIVDAEQLLMILIAIAELGNGAGIDFTNPVQPVREAVRTVIALIVNSRPADQE